MWASRERAYTLSDRGLRTDWCRLLCFGALASRSVRGTDQDHSVDPTGYWSVPRTRFYRQRLRVRGTDQLIIAQSKRSWSVPRTLLISGRPMLKGYEHGAGHRLSLG